MIPRHFFRHRLTGVLGAGASLLFLCGTLRAEVVPLTKLNAADLEARVAADEAAVSLYREGLQSALTYMRSEPELFPTEKLAESRLLREAEKGAIRGLWKRALDYVLTLDSISQYYQKYHKLKDKARKRDAFAIFHAAFLAEYSFALDFIATIENDPGLDKLLNDPVPELGLPEGTYAKFKFRFLNVARATEFAALSTIHKFLGRSDRCADLTTGMEKDAKVIWRAGRGKGPILTVKNAGAIIKRAGFTACFPVQAGISEWMGDTKVWRRGETLIGQEQILEMLPKLRPGDILLERREWHLSNVGLPGFWPHAALYVGTADERKAFFDDPEVTAWVREEGEASGDFEDLLRERTPEVYALSLKPDDEGHPPRVIEALSEGVVFTTLEHSAAADSVAVLRPRLSRQEKAGVLARAFRFQGRPYDFNFDFLTDSAMVCTEVVYKAYEPGEGLAGLRLPLIKVMGRLVTPANEIARLFDQEFDAPDRQMDLVLFLDGHEKQRKAWKADAEEFRASWRRPKWHVMAQETPSKNQ